MNNENNNNNFEEVDVDKNDTKDDTKDIIWALIVWIILLAATEVPLSFFFPDQERLILAVSLVDVYAILSIFCLGLSKIIVKEIKQFFKKTK